MIFPIRCFSCSKPVAHLWKSYKEKTEKGEEPGKVMDELGLTRYCCRAFLFYLNYGKRSFSSYWRNT